MRFNSSSRPVLVFRGKRDDFPGLLLHDAADGRDVLHACAAADFIRLGGNHRKGDAGAAVKGCHGGIVRGGFVADINQLQRML